MNWQTIFNPFSTYTEKQLLIFGTVLTIVGSIVGFLCNSSFNGTLDMHIVEKTNLQTVFLENTVNISTVTLLLFGLGKYFNNKTRFVDILNTAFWYRLPLYLVSLLSYFLVPSDLNERAIKNIKTPEKIFSEPLEIVFALIFGLATVLFATYSIVLLVNGFKTATNTKKWQHWAAFGFIILLSEAITQYIIKHFI